MLRFLYKTNLLVPVFLLFIFVNVSCVATSTTQAPPPMVIKKGVTPKVAFLPIGNTNDPVVAKLIVENLSQCLQDRNIFHFIPQDEVEKIVKETGYDMSKTFGLKASEYKILAEKLGVEYTFHGVVTIKKDLTLAGWRKDVDAYIYINEGATGEKRDFWRSMTEFSFGKISTITDAQKMGEAVANHICSKIIEQSR